MLLKYPNDIEIAIMSDMFRREYVTLPVNPGHGQRGESNIESKRCTPYTERWWI